MTGVPMTDLNFSVPKREVTVITFALDPDPYVYTFTAPKSAEVYLPIIGGEGDTVSELDATKAAFSWLGNGLPKKEHKYLEARLRNPDDDLDFDTLGDVVRTLMGRVSKRPTKSRVG